MTVEEAKYDILRRLGAQEGEYRQINPKLVAHWLSKAATKLVKKYWEKEGLEIPSSMLKRYKCVCIKKQVAGCDDDDCMEYVVELPTEVLDLTNDQGVQLVTRPGGQVIENMGGAGTSALINGSSWKPGESFIKVGSELIVQGGKYPKNLKLNLILIPSDISEFEDSAGFPAPSHLHFDILEEAEKIGLRAIRNPMDVSNDGNE